MGVTTVNDNVALFKVRLELRNEVVDGVTGLDKKDNATGSLEVGNELFDGVGTNDGFALSLVLKEMVDLGDGSVVGDNGVTVISGVKDQILYIKKGDC